MKVTSKTALRDIIEEVARQFGVNIDYDMAAELRLKLSDPWGATMDWDEERLALNSLALFDSFGIHEITHEWVLYANDLGECKATVELWNSVHLPVKLRRRPSWYVVECEVLGEPFLQSGPYEQRGEAVETIDRILGEMIDGRGSGWLELVTYTEVKRRGLLKDDD